jgi:hypothetical protein
MNAKRRIIVRIAISTCAVFATVLALGAIVGLRLNIASNSLPPGLYRIVPRGKGATFSSALQELPNRSPSAGGTGQRARAVVTDTRRCSNPSLRDTAIPSPSPTPEYPSMAGGSPNSKQYAKDALGRPLPQVPGRNVPSPARDSLGDLFLQPLQLRQPILWPNSTR